MLLGISEPLLLAKALFSTLQGTKVSFPHLINKVLQKTFKKMLEQKTALYNNGPSSSLLSCIASQNEHARSLGLLILSVITVGNIRLYFSLEPKSMACIPSFSPFYCCSTSASPSYAYHCSF